MVQKDFSLSFVQNFLPQLQKLEIRRQRIIAIYLLSFLTIPLLTVSSSWFLTNLPYAYLALLLLQIFFVLKNMQDTPKWRLSFKSLILINLIKYIDKDLALVSPKSFDTNKILTSGLFPQYYGNTDLYCDDLIRSIKYGQVEIAELELSKVIFHEEYKETKDIFKGLFISAQYQIPFQGSTYVLSKNFSKEFDSNRFQKVTLESTHLMAQYDIWSTNQIEARMCLQTDLMAAILDLVLKYKNSINLSFHNQKIYITINRNKVFFEPSIFQSIMNLELYNEFFDDITQILDVIKGFKLHQNSTRN